MEVGFDDCGVARAGALTDEEYPLREWIRRGWHGDLDYMERNADKRMDPRLLVPGAKSVICCVSAYPPPDSVGGTAAYAQHRDYHKDIKQMLFALGERLSKIPNSKFEIQNSKFCCDTVPISDKHWAARAGLGWIGRHTLLITPRWGSWVNLGEIVTTEEILPASGGNPGNLENRFDKISQDFDGPDESWKSKKDLHDFYDFAKREKFCEKCGKCVAACPNHALAPDGTPMLNVTRCTAYYTTHHQREIPPDIDPHGYTMGCDLCQLACPFNRLKQK